jgi:hypothetical protein
LTLDKYLGFGVLLMWYYIQDGFEKGPVTLEEIKYLISQKIVGSGTFVWQSGMKSWVTLRETELGDILPRDTPPAFEGNTPPPIPNSTFYEGRDYNRVRDSDLDRNIAKFFFDFTYKRQISEAVGFHISHVILSLIIGGIVGGVLGKSGAGYEVIVVISITFALIYSSLITILIIHQKKLSSSYYMLAVLAGMLALISGTIGGLVPAAILLTKRGAS